MSHDVAYTRRLFLSLLSTVPTILLSPQQGTPQTDHRHFVLNCVRGCDQCRLTSRMTRWLFLSLHRHHYPPQCPVRHPPNQSWHFILNYMRSCDQCRPTSRI